MKSKVRIPKRAWILVHMALLAWVAWIVAGITTGYFGEKMAEATYQPNSTNTYKMSPLDPSSTNLAKDFTRIMEGNIFNPAQRGVEVYQETDTFADPTSGEYQNATKTTLPVTLVGTVISHDRRRSIAAIQIKEDKEERIFTENDKLLEAKITKIERNRVYLSRNGKTEVLAIDFDKWKGESKGAGRNSFRGPNLTGDITETGDGNYAISRRYLNSQLANINQLITEVRAVPNISKDGTADGFKLFSVKKGSLFDRIGLKNRDVLKRVNGVEIDSAEKGLELFQALRNETDFSVDLERNNSKKSLQFSVQ